LQQPARLRAWHNGEGRHDPQSDCSRDIFAAAVTTGEAAQVLLSASVRFHPHDVAPAPDGSVWFSGQRHGFFGRFDPATGKPTRFRRPGAARTASSWARQRRLAH
jgi:streptogramin lyase